MTDNISTDTTFVVTNVHTMTTSYLNDLIADGFLYVNSESILDELHGRAIAEDVERGIEHLDTLALGGCLEFALLLDISVPRNAIAIRVLRDRLHEHALDEWRSTQRPGWTSTPHGKGCDCCGPGVSQWR